MAKQKDRSARPPQKTLVTYKDKSFPSMLRLKYKEGGILPNSLTGLYSSRVDAQKAIEYYNEGYDRKKIYPKAPQNDIPQRSVEKNGEEKGSSGV